jgi:hypothetical protein
VENRGKTNVLVLDGEQLIGAKQNRTANRSILLGAESITDIPVSCMERGRWSYKDRNFRSTRDHSPAKVRRKAREAEKQAVRDQRVASPQTLASTQSAVWQEIEGLSTKLGVKSATGALDEAYESRRTDFDSWARSFPLVDGQVGLMALTPRKVLGLDVIGSERLYRELHSRLLNGYLLDGFDQGAFGRKSCDAELPYRFDVSDEPDPDRLNAASRRFIGKVAGAQRTEAPTVGIGGYQVLTGAVVGGELLHDGRLVHLSAFPDSSDRLRGRRR